jgi:hypothetical protein
MFCSFFWRGGEGFVLAAGGWGGGLAAGVLWFCVGGWWWLAGGLAAGGCVLHWVCFVAFFMCTTFGLVGGTCGGLAQCVRDLLFYLPCWVGRLLPFVEFSMCHVILSNGTICFCSPMLGFHVLYCYVILPKKFFVLSVFLCYYFFFVFCLLFFEYGMSFLF